MKRVPITPELVSRALEKILVLQKTVTKDSRKLKKIHDSLTWSDEDVEFIKSIIEKYKD